MVFLPDRGMASAALSFFPPALGVDLMPGAETAVLRSHGNKPPGRDVRTEQETGPNCLLPSLMAASALGYLLPSLVRKIPSICLSDSDGFSVACC